MCKNCEKCELLKNADKYEAIDFNEYNQQKNIQFFEPDTHQQSILFNNNEFKDPVNLNSSLKNKDNENVFKKENQETLITQNDENKIVMDQESKHDAGVTGTDKNPFSREFGVSFSSNKQEVAAMLKKQLNGQSYVQLNEQGTIYMIPGENPDYGMLCGTNVYAVGYNDKWFMIDACIKNHDQFLFNVQQFVTDKNCNFEGIFITHAHHDHMDGAQNIIDLLIKLGKNPPKVYKRIDGNESELQRLKSSPNLFNYLLNTSEGDQFKIASTNFDNKWDIEIILKPINTPGHLSDHLCFLVSEKISQKGLQNKESLIHSIFTGDHIIGAQSTFFMNYPDYFNSLIKVQNLIHSLNIEMLYPAHSVSLYKKDVCLKAKQKVEDYISRRVEKDRKIEKMAYQISQYNELGGFTVDQFYQEQINQKVMKDPTKSSSIDHEFDQYFKKMLERQIMKLVADNKFQLVKIQKQNGETQNFFQKINISKM